RNINTPVAVLIEGMINPARLSCNPRLRITVKVGFIITSVGSIVVANMHIKKTPNHLYLYFAKANPHEALASTVSIVVTMATTMVLKKYFMKSIVDHEYAKLSKVGFSGKIFNG